MTEMIEAMPAAIDQEQLARDLVERARAEGVELTGPGGLLTGLTKTVLETALEAEMTGHLGYDRHDPAGRDGGNSRNGARAKTVQTEIGPVEVEVPRDRDGSFEPRVVRKRQRRLGGIGPIVISLTARGLTTGEISAHLAEVYGASISKDTISKITDTVIEEMAEWRNRPLDRVYPVLFIDAIVVKVRVLSPILWRGVRSCRRCEVIMLRVLCYRGVAAAFVGGAGGAGAAGRRPGGDRGPGPGGDRGVPEVRAGIGAGARQLCAPVARCRGRGRAGRDRVKGAAVPLRQRCLSGGDLRRAGCRADQPA